MKRIAITVGATLLAAVPATIGFTHNAGGLGPPEGPPGPSGADLGR